MGAVIMKRITWIGIFSLLFGFQTLAYADTANPPRIQSIEILDSKIFRPGDVMRIKVNYTGGNPGLTGIYVDAPCLKSIYAYNYSWENGRTKMEHFSFFQYLNKPESMDDQIVYAAVTNYCSDGVKKLMVTIEDATRLNDSTGTRGIEKTFTVQGGQLLEPGIVRPNKSSDVIELQNIPSILNYELSKESRYTLPRTTKNGQVVWWTSQGACKVLVPFFLDAGGSLVTTGIGTCNLEARLFPSDLFFAPDVNANVQFVKSNNWDFPKVGTFKVQDINANREAESKAAAEKLSCDANRTQLMGIQDTLLAAMKTYPKSVNSLAEVSARLQAALRAKCIAEITLSDFRTEVSFAISKAKESNSNMRMTITCIKGKLTKRVSGINPKCPAGYKKK